jgi:hypothetical protein
MRKSIRVSLLVMVMAVSAHAGDMQCGVTGTPPTQPATIEQEPIQESTASGDISNGAVNTFAEVALSVLAGMLAAL